jgi:NAD(P)-dependent dehydrogenase (short-subunit alcohol dehydrogenase family)
LGIVQALAGRVAIVTGASRGVGRGVGAGLGEAGATVYLTGRTPEDLDAAAEEVREQGGRAVPVRCDHLRDDEVEALFRRVREEQGRIDLLVNSAWGGYEHMVEDGVFTWPNPFWEQPRWRWDAMFQAGVRAAYVASALAAVEMVRARSGLIVHVSSSAGRAHEGNVAYGTAKAATDRLAADMAQELREHGVAALSLYPGLVRTEAVLASGAFDLSASESPQFVGRAVAALAADPHVLERSGQVVVTAELARSYGFTDLA